MFKTEPYAHQLTAFEKSKDREFFALLMDMGTGKSKVIIDTAAHLYGNGLIDACVVLAPNGVHRNWVINEIPIHCPDHVDPGAAYYVAQPRAQERRAWEGLARHKGLKFYCFNVESASNKKGQGVIKQLVSCLNVLLVLDESHRIKTPGAKRTRFIVGLQKQAEYRRILTGTAITQSPLDLYAQLKFLSPDITGFTTFGSFKAHFAELERKKTNNNKLGYYDEVVGYRNIDELERDIAPVCYRVTKEECLDLPEKVYERVYVELTPRQDRIYKQLLKDSVATLSESISVDIPDEMKTADDETLLLFYADQRVSAKNTLTKLLRLQQVVCGYAPDEEGVIEELSSNRIKTLLDIIDDTSGKVIIWARFRYDLALIAKALEDNYGPCAVAEYHGGVNKDERVESVQRFQDSSMCRFFVSQQHSGGIGLTLTAATTVIYYSNDYSLEARLQSEDRAHRIGQRNVVTYIDLVSPGTVDEAVLTALENKRRVADSFDYTGGNLR